MKRLAASATRWICLALASGLFLSYLPAYMLRRRRFTGAGLIGTAWGIILISGLPREPVRQIVTWLAVLLISVVISDVAEEAMGKIDDPRIVIDEFIGVWTALLFLPRTDTALILAFLFFRFFDVLKPSWIRRAGDLPGGWGVVLDDVCAGIAANFVLRAAVLLHLI